MFDKNIIDYVYAEKRSFDEFPFTRVDSLVLSQVSYLDFSQLVADYKNKQDGVSLEEICMFPDKSKFFQKTWSFFKNKILLKALLKSPRFKDVKLNFLSEKTDFKKEMQFAAYSFKIQDGLYYINYRGTDTSLVGWKEDFNMAYMFPVPAQEEALAYLEEIAPRLDGDLILGGHSKGGNLAVYASVMAKESIQSRIKKVYSLDSPGFMVDLSESQGGKRIEDRIEHAIPQGSIVGLLMNVLGEKIIVRSKAQGLLQHFPFNWIVEGDSFIIEDSITEEASAVNSTIIKWLEGMDGEKRKEFIEVVFSVLETGKIRDFKDINAESIQKIPAVVKTIKNMTEEETGYVLIALRSIITLMTGIGIKDFKL